ncbi:MAG: response regulator, partial [Pseudomonadota bacterium]
FRAGSDEPKAAPLALITRLEEIDRDKIERSNGQSLVQYRGRLIPLVFKGDDYGDHDGKQPILVFTDDDRSMGLAVDEILDIVDEKLDVEIISDQPGLIGSAVIKSKATEIVDVAYYLTQAYDDWFARSLANESENRAKRVLLVDDSAFFRNMIGPLLKVSGYELTSVESAAQALALREEGAEFDLIVSDIEMPDCDGFAFAEAVRSDEKWSRTPMLALSAQQSAENVARGHEVGFTDYVAKTDRDRLLEAISETIELREDAA